MADDEALRYLDAIHQLLRLVKAPEAEVAEVKKLYEAQRHAGLAAPDAPQPAPAAQRLELQAAEGPAKVLKPWIEVALPHPDVIANRFKEAEFAADLFAVDAGHATDGYATPTDFFGITFLTEGLKRVLSSALQRLSGTGGDPVIGLQTAFGGGKTPTMLAIYHLAKHLREGGDLRDARVRSERRPQRLYDLPRLPPRQSRPHPVLAVRPRTPHPLLSGISRIGPTLLPPL